MDGARDAGVAAYDEQQLRQLQDPIGWGAYLASPDFWNRTLQNWQSELLAVAAMVILSVYLRQWIAGVEVGGLLPHRHRRRRLRGCDDVLVQGSSSPSGARCTVGPKVSSGRRSRVPSGRAATHDRGSLGPPVDPAPRGRRPDTPRTERP
ncbi:DUF6766 family protein [Streptomyces virginiae]|uniref:DUF6766 family protein n=1 Tax=Streptomyces virginiae TaxID=1961 RepID=UPI003F54092C